jgi:hypothetical protein
MCLLAWRRRLPRRGLPLETGTFCDEVGALLLLSSEVSILLKRGGEIHPLVRCGEDLGNLYSS